MEHQPTDGVRAERGGRRPASPRTDLNALLLFYDTVNAGSINKAALQLGMPKSTISRKLALLEEQFGSTLLKRGPRALGLTEIGTALYERCERIVAELQDADVETSEMQSGVTGLLRVSMPVFFMSWMAEAIADFARDNPALRLEIEAHNRWVDVGEEPFDIAVQFGTPRDSSVPMRRLARLSRGLYASPDYLAARGMPRVVADLAGHELIPHQYQHRDRAWPEIPARDGGKSDAPGRVMVNHAVLVHELVRRGLGIGLMLDIMCRQDMDEGRLVRLEMDWEAAPLLVYATFLAPRYAPRKTRAFLDRIAAHIRERA